MRKSLSNFFAFIFLEWWCQGMRPYKLITYTDRQKIEELLGAGAKPAKIATEIGVHRATIYRELKRGISESTNGCTLNRYSADIAQKNVK